MKIYDISRELLSSDVYPGDPSPIAERVLNISDGAICNLTKLSMSLHNGTHIDAPLHFIDNAADITAMGAEVYYGECFVSDAADKAIPEGCIRLLIKGGRELTIEQAQSVVSAGVRLVGVEPQSVGGAEVHRLLLGAGITVLEGALLEGIPEGRYILSCPPLKINGADGAPCRALLIEN